MDRLIKSPENRKHVTLLLIAAVIALIFLLFRVQRAAAQITGEDYQNAVTLERLMILGMIGLVVLTWYYLKWRPPPDQQQDENPAHSERE